MIYESHFYKKELRDAAARMKKRLCRKKFSDEAFFLLERDVFFSFYIIRKLLEAPTKLTDRAVQSKVSLRVYKATGVKPNIRNRPDLDKLYNFGASAEITKDLAFVCNQAIHSYIFLPYFNDALQFEGVLFNSHYEKGKGLYELAAAEIIRLWRMLGKDDPSYIRYQYNAKTQDYDIECR